MAFEYRGTLSEGFDYDLWANRQWAGALGGFKNMLRAQQILEHILATQRTWLGRCSVEVIEPEGAIKLEDLFEHYVGAWQMVVHERDLNDRVVYRTSDGSSFANTVEEIARHVINHGTYHRGQMRGLAESDGFLNFPETDLIFFLRERKG